MSAVDPWPQAPILSALPPTARLASAFDPAKLRADLAHITNNGWQEIRIVSGDGLGDYATALDWRTVPLRSIGGDGSRGDAGGPDLRDFADTPWLARLPSFAELLTTIPAQLAAVRLMALGPGAKTPVHSDSKCGLPWGMVRLHVPIITVPEATLTIADEIHCWEAGTLRYADFTRGHMVANTGTRTRVHLVIDVWATRELLELFPPVFHAPEVIRGTLFQPPDAPLAGPYASSLHCAFDMPASFRSWEEADGEFLLDQPTVPAAIGRLGASLGLYLEGKPAFGLVHVGDGDFRFAGWTVERTIQVQRTTAGEVSVTLRSKVGSSVKSRTLPAKALGPSSRTA